MHPKSLHSLELMNWVAGCYIR